MASLDLTSSTATWRRRSKTSQISRAIVRSAWTRSSVPLTSSSRHSAKCRRRRIWAPSIWNSRRTSRDTAAWWQLDNRRSTSRRNRSMRVAWRASSTSTRSSMMRCTRECRTVFRTASASAWRRSSAQGWHLLKLDLMQTRNYFRGSRWSYWRKSNRLRARKVVLFQTKRFSSIQKPK